MKTIKYMQQFFLAVAFTAGLTACSSEEDFFTTPTSEITDANITIGAFPGFSENTVSRAIGTEDPGKTAWTSGDVVLLKTTFFSDAEKNTQLTTTTNKLTYDGSKWTIDSKMYWPDAAVAGTIKAWYAPNYELNQSGTLTLKSGESAGTCEMLTSEEIGVTKENMKATIAFQSRNYSRLRVSTDPGMTVTLTTANFTANDGTTTAENGLIATADDKGNVYFYGLWTADPSAKLETYAVRTYGMIENKTKKITLPTSQTAKSYAVAGPKWVIDKNYYYEWDAVDPVEGDNPNCSNAPSAQTDLFKACPTVQEIVDYLVEGWYWDNGNVPGNGLQTFSAPTSNGSSKSYSEGIWLKKKSKHIKEPSSVIFSSNFNCNDYKKYITSENAASIRTSNDYFFLPAAGYYGYSYGNSYFNDARGMYWSSSVSESPQIYVLYFYMGNADLCEEDRGARGALPMVAE